MEQIKKIMKIAAKKLKKSKNSKKKQEKIKEIRTKRIETLKIYNGRKIEDNKKRKMGMKKRKIKIERNLT